MRLIFRSMPPKCDYHLLCNHALFLNLKANLDKLKSLPNDMWIWGSNVRALLKRLKQKIHMNGFADLIVSKGAAEDEISTYPSQFPFYPD